MPCPSVNLLFFCFDQRDGHMLVVEHEIGLLRLTNFPSTMMRPFVNVTCLRIRVSSSHPALCSAGVMYLTLMSSSLRWSMLMLFEF